MKKLFLFVAVAGFLTACNNSASPTENKKDSLDSMASVKKDKIDSSADLKKDQIDSTTKAKKQLLDKMDSLNRKDSTKK